jgi:predicted RNase H-related nuclease YkuK (DUF458 family)
MLRDDSNLRIYFFKIHSVQFLFCDKEKIYIRTKFTTELIVAISARNREKALFMYRKDHDNTHKNLYQKIFPLETNL